MSADLLELARAWVTAQAERSREATPAAQGAANEALEAYRAARGPRPGDMARIASGYASAANYGATPYVRVLRVAAKGAAVELAADGRELRVVLADIRVEGCDLAREAEALVDELDDAPVVVIPCGGQKAPGRHHRQAQRLYTGPYFRKALAAALAMTRPDRVRILSGRYGFLRLESTAAPYEQRIDQPGAIGDEDLARQVAADPLLRRARAGEVRLVVMAGAAYVSRAAQAFRGATLELPLAGSRGIGDQLAALGRIAAGDAGPTCRDELAARACALLLNGRRFCGAPSVGPGWPCRHHTLELLACFAAQLPPSHLGAWRHRRPAPVEDELGQLSLFVKVA